MNGLNPHQINVMEQLAANPNLRKEYRDAVAWGVTHLKEQQIKCDNLFLAMASIQEQRDMYKAIIEGAINTQANEQTTIEFLQESLRDMGGH